MEALGRRALNLATVTAANTLMAAATTTASSTMSAASPSCTVGDLPQNAIIVLNDTATITLSEDALFQYNCKSYATGEPNSTLWINGPSEPFLASTIPQIFVLGAMLFLAWILVFILIITPRTYFVVGSNGGGVLGRRGMLGGATGTTSVVGVGGRPWLQKAATLGVGVSLLIATVNSFNVAARQYAAGFEDAQELTKEVVGSTELQIIRIISFTFLWLAQVQTLIRLFPRHKEKIIIKWIGFALIFLDTLFAILNNFYEETAITKVPDSFKKAIPALAYLFQLALNLIYLFAVLSYSWAKRRFAYYHPKMRNVAVVAFLSICSIFIPVVFFVLDVISTVFIGWGDYCRWVGAAAASVVVWEWVERIEALEREERKDGILGREVFDGDDVPYSTSNVELRWPRNRKIGGRKSSNGSSNGSKPSDGSEGSGGSGGSGRTLINSIIRGSLLSRTPKTKMTLSEKTPPTAFTPDKRKAQPSRPDILDKDIAIEPIQPPQNVASPVSRADTTSAASTVYAVIHHPADSSTPLPSRNSPPHNNPSHSDPRHHPGSASYDFSAPPPAPPPLNTNMTPHQRQQITDPRDTQISPPLPPHDAPQGISHNPFSRSSIHNPFKRQRTAPPPEVTAAMTANSQKHCPTRKRDRLKFHRSQQTLASELPTFTIPAREDGGAWSPQEERAEDYMSSEGSSPVGSNTRTNEDGTRPTITQMPSLDGMMRAATQTTPPPARYSPPRGSRNSPARSTPSPANGGSQQSTPSPRPPASGDAGRMPVLEENSRSGEERET